MQHHQQQPSLAATADVDEVVLQQQQHHQPQEVVDADTAQMQQQQQQQQQHEARGRVHFEDDVTDDEDGTDDTDDTDEDDDIPVMSPEDAPAVASRNVYIARLPIRGFSDSRLVAAVSPFGKVVSARIMRSRGTGASKGYAFVLFETEEQAKECVEGLHGKHLEGTKHPLECRFANMEASDPDRMTTHRRGSSRGGKRKAAKAAVKQAAAAAAALQQPPQTIQIGTGVALPAQHGAPHVRQQIAVQHLLPAPAGLPQQALPVTIGAPRQGTSYLYHQQGLAAHSPTYLAHSGHPSPSAQPVAVGQHVAPPSTIALAGSLGPSITTAGSPLPSGTTVVVDSSGAQQNIITTTMANVTPTTAGHQVPEQQQQQTVQLILQQQQPEGVEPGYLKGTQAGSPPVFAPPPSGPGNQQQTIVLPLQSAVPGGFPSQVHPPGLHHHHPAVQQQQQQQQHLPTQLAEDQQQAVYYVIDQQQQQQLR